MYLIKQIIKKSIKNSRDEETLELTLVLESGEKFSASVPQGSSTGSHEAKYLSVKAAFANMKDFVEPFLLNDNHDLSIIDIDHQLLSLDGTYDKSNLGANSILATSLAMGRLMAHLKNFPLYQYLGELSGKNDFRPSSISPMMVLIEGGKHSKGNRLIFQEFLCVPRDFPSFEEKVKAGIKVMNKLEKIFKEKNINYHFGDEKGFAPQMDKNEEAIELAIAAIKESGFNYPDQVGLGIDVAASSIHLSRRPSIDDILSLADRYQLFSLEDPMAEEMWRSWQILKAKHENGFLLIGDDLFTSNSLQLMKGIRLNTADATIIKPNQIGTISEIISAVKMARTGRMQIIVSHRSGETMDDFIADLAVGVGAEFFKSGASREDAPERMSKYNRIIEIEKELNLS